ncbi:MAG TPA: PhnD/SsuA/transferrin family substrate-binding protein [Myxococcales bacterium]|nr:PhnD/SsuA/transferrin family substrate-binding protein [Myxococcales bacterium]
MLALAAVTLVVCAPGYPGSTAEAQPAMDTLAAAIARAAHWPVGSIAAVYDESEAAGLQRLAGKDAALLLAPLPFFLAHEQDLHLAARLAAAPQGGDLLERWTLVTGKDHPPSLQGYTVFSSAGYAKRFVRAAAPSLPAQAQIESTSAVLSVLRRAADGEKVAALLDGSQAAALGTLPFASSLAVLGASPPMPAAVVATVGKRMDERRWKELEAALLNLAEDRSARNALDGVRMAGFVPLDEQALAAARTAYRRAK